MMPFFKNKIQYILLFSAVIAILSMAAGEAYAQRKNISGQEMALLTFYKLTGLPPNFKSWVLTNPLYTDMANNSKDMAEMFLHEEILRLQWGLGVLEPENTFMHIEAAIIGKILLKDNKSYFALSFPDKRKNARRYFPYNIGDVRVAVIMKDIEDYMIMELSADQLHELNNYTSEINNTYPLILKFTYRGISAEKEPMKIDGLKQYIMLGEIAHWQLLLPDNSAKGGKTLLEHIQPWYRTEEEDDLIKMLQGE